jgi:RHS repeat-associated protein
MTPTSPTKTVNVNVAGKRELKLVVTQAGDGPAWDHADWANARLKSETYLSDLDWSYSQGDYYPTTKDRTVNGNAIRLNRATYQKGLGVHANSDVRFNLGGNYSTFISDIGVDDNATTVGSVVFEVWADGAKLYDSGVMTPTSPTKTVNVNVAGKRELKLVVTQAGDGPTWDHADWADARLTKSSAVQPGNPAPGAVQIKWLVTDQLGTPRMTIDQTGRLAGVTRHDYLPFGEEISHLREQLFPGIELKRGYIADNVRQQFTGYERDTETGLDYAQARYYSNVQGRFTGVDPLLASGNPSNPQSWNRYGYVLNNPMRLTDPTGMIPQDTQKTKPEQQTAPMPQAPQEDPLSPEDINGPADAVIYEHDVTGYNEAVRKADSAAELCVNKAVNNLMLGIDQATPTKKQFFTELGVGIGVGAIAGAQITSKSKSIHFSLLGAGVGAIGGEIAAVTNLLNNQAKGYRDAKLAFITEIENCKLEWKHAMPKELPHSVITWDFENINRGGLEAKKIQSSRNPWFFVNKTVEKYRKETQ